MQTDVGFDMDCVDDHALDDMPMEVLERQITSFAGRLAAATATWLIWIAAFDRREGWRAWEQTSCAGWLNWKCGIEPRTAQEHVRVGRAIERLPRLRAMFLAGEVSYSKARAISRVAHEHNEDELCELALSATASQLDRVCAGLRTADDRVAAEWAPSVAFHHNDNHGRIIIDVPIDDYQRVKAIIESVADQLIDERLQQLDGVDGINRSDAAVDLGGRGAVQAAAVTALIDGDLDSPEGPFEDAMLVIDDDLLLHADVSAERSAERTGSAGEVVVAKGCCTLAGDSVPPLVAKRIACDSRLQLAIADSVGAALGYGREQRVVNRALRRQLMRRDHGVCRFPG